MIWRRLAGISLPGHIPVPQCRRCGSQQCRHWPASEVGLPRGVAISVSFSDADLHHWDADGKGSTFKKYYPEHYDLALSYGLDPALRPTKLDISETVRWLGYKPSYGLASLLSELAAYGDRGPPQLTEV
jgi:hypothetical protein